MKWAWSGLGHILSMVRVRIRVRASASVRVRVKYLYRYPTCSSCQVCSVFLCRVNIHCYWLSFSPALALTLTLVGCPVGPP